jgi:alpha-amylase
MECPVCLSTHPPPPPGPGVRAMVGWYNAVGEARQANWWDDGANVISFSRGNRGWVAFNNGTAPKRITVRTGLPHGSYCDVVHGGATAGGCAGQAVVVDKQGRTTVTVPAKDALAVTRADRR